MNEEIRMAMIIKPQKGPQERFLATRADICIYGGAAGGGKTYGLLLDPIRYIDKEGFNALIFRKNYTQVTAPGGLWDTSMGIYNHVRGAYPYKSPKLHWRFPNGVTIGFAQIERDSDCFDWQGSQITYIGFDELTHFSEYSFFYMLSRNRTTCGVKPYVRATCNPDSDSWVAKFISWWIDQKTGYPISERSGKLRWMVRINEKLYWFNDREEAVLFTVKQGVPLIEAEIMPKSVTFISSTLRDNQILMAKNPEYLANLYALPEVEKERLLRGNWKIKASAGAFFKRIQVKEILTSIPLDIVAFCRAWDLAATEEDENKKAAYTAGVLMAMRTCGRFLVIDVINQRLKAGDVRKLVRMTANSDNTKYGAVRQRLPQDPGQAGKDQAQSYTSMLMGYDVVTRLESGSKEARAEPMAAQWQNGFFDVMAGEWNEEYFNQLESFPESDYKDMVDASSSAFSEITLNMSFQINSLL